MSRIGKKEIIIPKDVSVEINDEKIIVKGKHGTLERTFLEGIKVSTNDNKIVVTRENNLKRTRAFHGLIRALIQNMVSGVNEKFSKTLIAEGVGYKFQVEKKNLILSMGYSHPIELPIPDDLSINLESPTKISVIGIEKEKVGFLAAQIRKVRPPEPYKGKGIRYEGETILRKAGKTGK
jgi:large subunit ribosomal protein L6|uniref:50S ribosomal protein L6 n=1 Tax=Ochromonas sp. CCMP1393 TaxID=420556 RepID=A0A0D3MKQ2_9STRA|nr:50S ribosomal protein L6 [Ochromonas sp. CCMP1393]